MRVEALEVLEHWACPLAVLESWNHHVDEPKLAHWRIRGHVGKQPSLPRAF